MIRKSIDDLKPGVDLPASLFPLREWLASRRSDLCEARVNLPLLLEMLDLQIIASPYIEQGFVEIINASSYKGGALDTLLVSLADVNPPAKKLPEKKKPVKKCTPRPKKISPGQLAVLQVDQFGRDW